MKITKTDLTNLIRDELENFKIVKLTADDMEQLHKSGQMEKDGVFYQYQEPVEEGKKIIVKSIPGRKIQLDLENEAQAFIDGLKRDNKKISLKNISDYIDAEYKFFNSPKLNHQVFNYIKKNLKKLSEGKINEKTFGSQAQYDAYRKKHNLKPLLSLFKRKLRNKVEFDNFYLLK